MSSRSRARSSTDSSGYPSNIVTGIPLGPIGPPVVTATPGNEQVDLSWTKPGVIGGHEIEWHLGRDGARADRRPWLVFQLIDAPAYRLTVTGLTNGQEYVFEVIAKAPTALPVPRAQPALRRSPRVQ